MRESDGSSDGLELLLVDTFHVCFLTSERNNVIKKCLRLSPGTVIFQNISHSPPFFQ